MRVYDIISVLEHKQMPFKKNLLQDFKKDNEIKLALLPEDLQKDQS